MTGIFDLVQELVKNSIAANNSRIRVTFLARDRFELVDDDERVLAPSKDDFEVPNAATPSSQSRTNERALARQLEAFFYAMSLQCE
jgi:hypothetical protein